MVKSKCPHCQEGEIIYKIYQGFNQGVCNKCGNAVAFTWLREQFNGARLNPYLTPKFEQNDNKS